MSLEMQISQAVYNTLPAELQKACRQDGDRLVLHLRPPAPAHETVVERKLIGGVAIVVFASGRVKVGGLELSEMPPMERLRWCDRLGMGRKARPAVGPAHGAGVGQAP